MLLPNFIIIGAMKAGTTTLYDQLRRQPGIYLPELKEPNFFSNDDQYARGIDWYSSLFASARADDVIGEASTHYTKLPTFPSTVARMRTILENPRFIYVMRHPIDRLISQYIHQWSEGEFRFGLEEAIERHPELIHYSCYSLQLAPYVRTFGVEAILPVFFERMLANPDETFSRICEFIGYKGEGSWTVGLAAQNASNERLRKFPGYKVLVQSKMATDLRRYFAPRALRARIRQSLTMKRRPTLNLYTRRRLEQVFESDFKVLEGWFGAPITWESFSQNK